MYHKKLCHLNATYLLQLVSFSLLVAALFLGLQLLSNDPSHWTIKIMGGFVGWEALAVIALDVNLRLKKKGKL